MRSILPVLVCSVAIWSGAALAQPAPGPGGGGPGDPPRATPGLAPAIVAAIAAGGYLGYRKITRR